MPTRMPDGEEWGQWPARLSAECGPLAAAAWAAIRRRMGPRDEPAAVLLADLAATLRRHPGTVRRVVALLEFCGWISRRATGRANLYVALVAPARAETEAPRAPRPRASAHSDRAPARTRTAPPYTTPRIWRRNRGRG